MWLLVWDVPETKGKFLIRDIPKGKVNVNLGRRDSKRNWNNTWFMYWGLERRLCIICDTAGFCINWFMELGSGVEPSISSNPGNPRPLIPPSGGGLAFPAGFTLGVLFVWAPPPARYTISQFISNNLIFFQGKYWAKIGIADSEARKSETKRG